MSAAILHSLSVPVFAGKARCMLQLGDGHGHYTNIGVVDRLGETGLDAVVDAPEVLPFIRAGGQGQPWRIFFDAGPTGYACWDVQGVVQDYAASSHSGVLQIAFSTAPRLVEESNHA